jgi:hypothetical protein
VDNENLNIISIYKSHEKWIIYSVNQRFETIEIIQGLREEAKLSSRDLNNFNKCKKEKIRESKNKSS